MGKCKNCKFWELGYGLTKEEREEENIKEEPNYGHCRRYAPKPRSSKTDDWFSCDWPETQGSDWCGEFQPKKNEEKDLLLLLRPKYRERGNEIIEIIKNSSTRSEVMKKFQAAGIIAKSTWTASFYKPIWFKIHGYD